MRFIESAPEVVERSKWWRIVRSLASSFLILCGACEERAGEQQPIAAQTAPAKPSISARQILIEYRGARLASPALDRDKEQARALARKLREDVQAGADFEKLALEYSAGPEREKGGALGKIPLDKLERAFLDPVPKLAVGELAPVLESPFGFHVLQRTD